MQLSSNENSTFRIFPENAPLKLEFDVIKSAVLNNCISEIGRNETLLNGFVTDKRQIVKKLLEVKDFQDIISQDLTYPLDHYHNLAELLKMMQLADYTILTDDLLHISQFLNTVELIIAFNKKYKEQYPNIFLLVAEVDFKSNLKSKINTIIDIDGNIKSSASDKLSLLRKSISEIEHDIDKNFDKVLHACKSSGWLADEEESVRNGERVLAVLSKYKRKIRGIIYDESITGKTTFIQPEAILNLRNKWFDLKQKEKREIYIILKELTKFIRPFVPDLYSYQQLVAYIDHVRAKARYSNYVGAAMPIISLNPEIKIVHGYHPVLLSKNRLSGKKTIPVDLELDENNRILLISGPNAGGKSVCLKTVGLFQLMIQYGLPIPADENSVIGIFSKLFVDIGDDQSIENDLSTYSSRLMNQHYFIKNADTTTLFLIDEFGSGTEPATGGIIAEVILEKLNGLRCRGVATTHYTNLKVFAGKTKGLMNAAMLFDTNKLQPLYKLKTGEPGSSFALEILENIGFDTELIQTTRQRLQKDELDLNKLLIELQAKKETTDALLYKLQNKENELNKLLEENSGIKSDIKTRKNQIITQSREEAELYLQKLNREFEQLIRQWKEAQQTAKEELSKSIRKQIQNTREKVATDITAHKAKAPVDQAISFSEGDDVILKETGQKGSIIRLNKNNMALVQFGNIKTLIELNKLNKAAKQPAKPSLKLYNQTINSIKSETFNPVLDIRGMRMAEAIHDTEMFLDKAIIHDFAQLKIIHGHGDGILKKAIRTLLKQYSFIKDFHGERADFGGDGVTIIEL